VRASPVLASAQLSSLPCADLLIVWYALKLRLHGALGADTRRGSSTQSGHACAHAGQSSPGSSRLSTCRTGHTALNAFNSPRGERPAPHALPAHRYGQFSHLWIDMQQRMGLDVHVVDCPWGEGAHEDKLEQILKQDTGKKIKAVSGGMGEG